MNHKVYHHFKILKFVFYRFSEVDHIVLTDLSSLTDLMESRETDCSPGRVPLSYDPS